MVPKFLYHGTSATALPAILTEGIKPRGRKRGNWQHTVTSAPDRVYLTHSYAMHFAFAATKRGQDAAVLEVDTSELPATRFVADEDFLEQVTVAAKEIPGIPRSIAKQLLTWSIKRRTLWFRQHAREFDPFLSLQHLGTITYDGIIPAHTIRRVATISHEAVPRLSLAFDPIICLLNYKILGEHYRSSVQWLFDGTPITNSFNVPSWNFSPSRDGIAVTEVPQTLRREDGNGNRSDSRTSG